MQTIQMLYGSGTMELRIPQDSYCQILESRTQSVVSDPEKILRDALENPIGSADIRELTKTAKTILIITNDNTRPMPSNLTIPALIGQFFYPKEHYDITILIAAGLHRAMTDAEIRQQLGNEVAEKYPVVVHSATNQSSLTSFGLLPSGKELFLNRLVKEHDLVIAEGFIEPHFFAGYSGGRKSILPGVAGADNILENHSPNNIANPGSCQANLVGNPIHDECVAAARLANLQFILNVALNKDKQIIAAFAGHPEIAHLEGCRFVEAHMTMDALQTDIVVASNNGYPLDRNLYQVVKGIDTAAKVARKGGAIIMTVECLDGVGHDSFRALIQSCASVEELNEKMSLPPCDIDKWQVQVLARALIDHTIILVSGGIERELAEQLFFGYAATLDEALVRALSLIGEGASISVLPEGPVIIPRIK